MIESVKNEVVLIKRWLTMNFIGSEKNTLCSDNLVKGISENKLICKSFI